MNFLKTLFYSMRDSHKEKAHLNKTQALTKSMNTNIWLVGTLNQNMPIFSTEGYFKNSL